MFRVSKSFKRAVGAVVAGSFSVYYHQKSVASNPNPHQFGGETLRRYVKHVRDESVADRKFEPLNGSKNTFILPLDYSDAEQYGINADAEKKKFVKQAEKTEQTFHELGCHDDMYIVEHGCEPSVTVMSEEEKRSAVVIINPDLPEDQVHAVMGHEAMHYICDHTNVRFFINGAIWAIPSLGMFNLLINIIKAKQDFDQDQQAYFAFFGKHRELSELDLGSVLHLGLLRVCLFEQLQEVHADMSVIKLGTTRELISYFKAMKKQEDEALQQESAEFRAQYHSLITHLTNAHPSLSMRITYLEGIEYVGSFFAGNKNKEATKTLEAPKAQNDQDKSRLTQFPK